MYSEAGPRDLWAGTNLKPISMKTGVHGAMQVPNEESNQNSYPAKIPMSHMASQNVPKSGVVTPLSWC